MYYVTLFAINAVINILAGQEFAASHKWGWAVVGLASLIGMGYCLVKYVVSLFQKDQLYLGESVNNGSSVNAEVRPND